jgi:hypothetical protein
MKKETASDLISVFVPKRLEVVGIRGSRTGRGLDLDPQKIGSPLHD